MRKIDVIGVPMKYGCPVNGADLAYSYTKDIYEKVFNCDSSSIDTSNYLESISHDNIKNVEAVMEISKDVYNKVNNSLLNNHFPIIVGGDHSTAIGSMSSVIDYYKDDVSVIWIDAHMDIHNEKTTPSGNVHGMPLSICIGRCDDRFDIGTFKLNPNNLYYIGLRDYEKEEYDYVSKNCTYIKYDEVNAESINKIVEKINTKYVHISFDLDVMSNNEFSAVNVLVDNKYAKNGGISLNKTKEVLNILLSKLNVCSMDIVEYNPTLDNDLSCKKKIEEILELINKKIN